MSIHAADALMGIFGFKRVDDEITLDNPPSLDDDGGSLNEGMKMSEVKNEGLEVVAMLTVSFDEGDGGSAIEQVETHTLLDEGAHDLCRHSEALAGYAVRDARIMGLESRYQRDVWGLNNEGDPIGGEPAGGYANDNARLRAELAAIKAQEPVNHEFQDRDGKWYPFITAEHKRNTIADGSWPIRALYAAPIPDADHGAHILTMVVPDGYKLVPIEPTAAQCFTAAFNLCNEFGDEFVRDNKQFALAAYRSLVAASPSAKGSSQ